MGVLRHKQCDAGALISPVTQAVAHLAAVTSPPLLRWRADYSACACRVCAAPAEEGGGESRCGSAAGWKWVRAGVGGAGRWRSHVSKVYIGLRVSVRKHARTHAQMLVYVCVGGGQSDDEDGAGAAGCVRPHCTILLHQVPALRNPGDELRTHSLSSSAASLP